MRFVRQLKLDDFDQDFQQQIAMLKVAIVGVGGLGAPVVMYLAAAGLKNMTLIDDDVIEVSNLNRQILFRVKDVGRYKVARAAEWVKDFDESIVVDIVEQRLSVNGGRELLADFDMVFDCSDGLPTKYLLNDLCVLENIPLIHAAITAFSAQLLVVESGGHPCLRCLFPEVPPPSALVPNCRQSGVLGASVGIIGSWMVQEALLYLAYLFKVKKGDAVAQKPIFTGSLISFDLKAHKIRSFRFPELKSCRVCGEKSDINGYDLEDYEISG